MPPSSLLNRDTTNAPFALKLSEIFVLTTKKADKDPKIKLNKIM
jgi:hypothetical protein